MQKLDDIDRRMLRALMIDPDLTSHELGEKTDQTPARAARRLDRLVDTSVVEGFAARVDFRKLGYEVSVSLRVTLDKTVENAFDQFIAASREIIEIDEIQTFLGRVDVRLNVMARDMAHYQQIYRHHILTLPHISDIEALMLVSEVKNTQSLPL
jgi:Lrp/AsnC family transcriptional regulator